MPPLSKKSRKALIEESITKKAIDYKKGNRYLCPRCKVVHHWQAGKCFNPKCKFVGTLTLITNKFKTPVKKVVKHAKTISSK